MANMPCDLTDAMFGLTDLEKQLCKFVDMTECTLKLMHEVCMGNKPLLRDAQICHIELMELRDSCDNSELAEKMDEVVNYIYSMEVI